LPSYEQSYAPRIRVEIYFPIVDQRVYKYSLKWLIGELTQLRRGCTVQENISGYFLSQSNQIITDRINVVYSDFNLDWSDPAERAEALEYCVTLKQFLMQNLWEEEEILISVYPITHVRQ
jgi:hypothetical protein